MSRPTSRAIRTIEARANRQLRCFSLLSETCPRHHPKNLHPVFFSHSTLPFSSYSRPTRLLPPFSRTYTSPFPTAYRSTIFRPLNAIVICVPILTLFLGIWQVRRLRWKVALIDEVERNLTREPMILPDNIKYVVLLSSYTATTQQIRNEQTDSA